MISVYQLKSRFQDLLRPICQFLANIGVTANMVTISAFILSAVTGFLVYYYVAQTKLIFWLLPVALFVRMALNAIDGMLAREHNQKSNVGAVLNELGDIVSDVVIYVPFLYVLHVNIWAIFMFAILTLISETVGIMGIQINASRRYDGPMGKSDRAFWLSVAAAIAAHVVLKPVWVDAFVCVILFFLFVTITNRIMSALKEAKEKAENN